MFIQEIIDHPSFKIDTFLPNYLIYCKLNKDDKNNQEVHSQFNQIVDQIRCLFQNVIDWYIQAINLKRVPQKLSIIFEIEKALNYIELHDKIKSQLNLDLQAFLYCLTQIQDIYTNFFIREFFTLVEQKNVLDDRINLNWFIIDIQDKCVEFIIQQMGTANGLLYAMIIEQLYWRDIIITINKVIVTLFNEASTNLQKITNQFIIDTSELTIGNKYISLGLFQELSTRAYDLVNELQDYTIFQFSNQDSKEEFARLVINYFDQMVLYITKEDEETASPCQLQILQYVKSNQDEIEGIQQALMESFSKNQQVITHRVVSKISHKPGLLIEMQNEQKSRFIIHKPQDSFVVTNAKLVLNRWIYQEALLHLTPEELVHKMEETQTISNSIQQAFRQAQFTKEIENIEGYGVDDHISFYSGNQQTSEVQNVLNHQIHIQQGVQITPYSAAAGDIGASLGNCLANINRYNSKKQFLIDFGQTAAISGTITYIANQMPVIGQLVALGGLGYFATKIYSNDSSSLHGKNTQFNKLMISTTTNIGGGIGGALLGQALIPIPFFGALIGGIVGGILGGASSTVLIDFMSEKRFQNLFQEIKNSQKNGYWEYNEDLLDMIGLSDSIFIETIPDHLKDDEQRTMKWFTMILYFFLTILQSQYDAIQEKERKKELEKKKKKQQIQKQEEEVEEEQADLDFPEEIESALKWIIYQKCLIGISLDNIQKIIKCIFQNL